MIRAIAFVMVWVLLTGMGFLILSVGASFAALEWRWFGQTGVQRAFLFAVMLWIAAKLPWTELRK